MRSTFCLLLLLLTACVVPTATPERLPTRALTPTPTPTPTPFSIAAQTYYEEGMARREAGDTGGAFQSFTWAIQLTPDFAPAYVARGALYLAQGDFWRALADADSALAADPANAAAYALRGETLRLRGRPRSALESFDMALELDPALESDVFRSCWLAARAVHEGRRLLVLSREYADAHPQDPLRCYYRGWAFIELGTPGIAINILTEGIEAAPEPPALLWFVLGHAYAANHFWQEAVISFEAARALMQAGDASLSIHSDQPVVALFGALGRAYLGAERCVDAEAMLEYALEIGAPTAEYAAELEEARICQTPTPTITPYPTTTPSAP